MAEDRRLPLISATGSCGDGREVGADGRRRLGPIVAGTRRQQRDDSHRSANLDLALRAVLFAAVGTAGQRCTTLRRLIIHESIADRFCSDWPKPTAASDRDPLGGWRFAGAADQRTAVERCSSARGNREDTGRHSRLRRQAARSARLLRRTDDHPRPGRACTIVREETFAPILYVMTYHTLDEAIAIHNASPRDCRPPSSPTG